MNKTIATLISMYDPNKQETWDEFLPMVLWAYRVVVQDSLQESPYFSYVRAQDETVASSDD
jgi:hypothetical protein